MMSTQYGRLAYARDNAHPITPTKRIEVYAADLDAMLMHYAETVTDGVTRRVMSEHAKKLREGIALALERYDARSELYTNGDDLAAAMADTLRPLLTIAGGKHA